MATTKSPATAHRTAAPWLKWTAVGVGAGAALASSAAGAVSGLAVYFARQIVTPSRIRVENLDILAVVGSPGHQTVILPANDDTTIEGTYSLHFDQGAGHARIGAIRSYVPREGTVEREVEKVYAGDLQAATRGWWGGAVYPSPGAMGFAEQQVLIPVEGGSAPAWLVRAESPASTWAVMVHGRGATRAEALRALTPARRLGLTSLVLSYRNDGEAPSAPDGRYGLGMTEWHDVDAAIDYAVAHGAEDVVLFGWSMGGAIALQTADLSRHRRRIRALVLDGPVINWMEVLAHHAELNRIPAPVGRLGQYLLSSQRARRITGLAAPLDLKSMDWIARAEQLTLPTLVLHSEDDEFVPIGPSVDLAAKNPGFVTLERFHRARHTKEWNVDPDRWEAVVEGWLRGRLFGRTLPGGRSREAAAPERDAGATELP
ncbi:alpha/beta fold hydrolase [Arthrobacter agilis]|uniref:alpha/beta hydrolase family protein n=1 Tax=Arthrobacter agilis TaxID=37921 RepID=UPI002366A51F|nr:alpha/beta fold hydrolase [Arthrobacter agilis]WDF31951.1 alpha/beta fold hydrolase [Arthrobacter agilis]